MIGNPKTNLIELQRIFGEAIQTIRETDSTGLTSSFLVQRATIVFLDGSLLYITEYLSKQQLIERFNYDWISPDKTTVLAKFHSEPHTDKDYQTDTEPYHTHPPEHAKLNNAKRYPNYFYNDLFSIVEGIHFFHLLPKQGK
ncbi:hypothetical protein SD70_24970 [Gordoniibacillus kamchatkensis]|uniref:Uncharacterized protein n=1 Tax=Gordoniibacillus kamchatkensis TaxID=1590651 RepID=A0ABR5ACD4_9BACL|nr:DUF6516 family protein [Paenibacillus sp. VKM B-2647]KIL38701.1 hypothetical protein SD70_24970 [Paenibacillus sp. VKM B-2647]